jgi:hypothetical protein
MSEDDLTPEKCRRHAIEWRCKAARLSDLKGKEHMLRVAAEYDQLAESLAALTGHQGQATR